MLSKRNRLEKEINTIHQQLSSFPDGKLICAKNGNYIKWYISDGHTETYLPKKSRQLAEQLAAKKYLTLKAIDLQQEKNAIDLYLRHHRTEQSRAEQLLSDTSGYAELLSPYFQPQSEDLFHWSNASYERNPKNPEQLIYKTIAGTYVRSKSETLIATLLYINQIPFRYECALSLDFMTIYPDFTIRHPKTGEYFYWEHFGLMDNPNYSRIAVSKLEHYTANGIIPSVQLITTYETKEYPLNTDLVENLIKYYFLDR